MLWTRDTQYFVIGITFGPGNVLWGFDIHDHSVIHVGDDGVQLPTHHFADRCFGSVSFTRDGELYFGEYLIGSAIHRGTSAKTIPGSDILGHGNIFHFDAAWNFVEELEVDNVPELTNFKGTTHQSLHPSGDFIAYTAETGKRILRYNIRERQQMTDLVSADGAMHDQNWYIAMHYLRDGRLIVTRGESYDIYDEQGMLLDHKPMGRYGWAQITTDWQEQYIYSANVWTGEVCKVDITSGEVLALVETSNSEMTKERQRLQQIGEYKGARAPKRAAAGIAVYPGADQGSVI